MPSKVLGKRPASFQKRSERENKKAKVVKPVKASERKTIPIPEAPEDDDESGLSEQDLEFFAEDTSATKFLQNLDKTAIARSKNEQARLHALHKPIRQSNDRADSLPSIDSDDDEKSQYSWSSAVSSAESDHDSDVEQDYETKARPRRDSWDSDKSDIVERLPIKLADGSLQKVGEIRIARENSPSESEEEFEEAGPSTPPPPVEDVSTGARFGRPSVISVISLTSRKARVQAAKDQLGSICQDIISDPENSLGLLRRLHTFSLPKISTPTQPEPVTNDIIIRKLAFLSQMAVFKDIIPGYRVRSLTDAEKAEKVSQLVSRTREWEQGLVSVYQSYLRSLEAEIKAKGELAEVALQCMCTLLVEATHFNFRINIMSCVVSRLSKKSWDESSELCLQSLITVFKNDLTGLPSLEAVRLLNRMIKERHFNVHPNVLSCLLHLRLKSELSVRASRSHADKPGAGAGSEKPGHSNVNDRRHGKGKNGPKTHLSKKAKKALKENKEIEKEMREAAAEVDKEERAATQTETLKLLFVLYFSILKNHSPKSTLTLLPPALEGISKFAHLVNVDFFKDLLATLREIITRLRERETNGSESENVDNTAALRLQLLCVATASELLSGQGEALNIDLDDFVNHLYTLIIPFSITIGIEDRPQTQSQTRTKTSGVNSQAQSCADLFFRCLTLMFHSRSSNSNHPSWRCAAFAKRLAIASLSLPPASAARAIDSIRVLLAKHTTLDALLSTVDRASNGVYRPFVDDPQLSNAFASSFYELHMLCTSHCDARVRKEALRLASSS
ncbi:nucleolar complex-associated protein 3 [Sistotremastrum niveocremeum HHB9708]|uniref:Nucleolar complex-associated protein 3 n=1 Tax=Sistotremastrum niveocremeum HHB9708 TaxID=1314777 RepID=A0A165AMS8_9AGAM|nr:nucleolar complex-associated protein 3 [Sistotremastrum niveocremeum HHB9708]